MNRTFLLAMAFLLVFSARGAYAYPVHIELTGLGGVGGFHTDVYHCTDSSCSSMDYYASDLGNPTHYSLLNEGPGDQYFVEFDYKDCFVPFIYTMVVDSYTCNDCFSYDLYFYREPECYAPVLSMKLSDDTVYEGDEVSVLATIRAVWLMHPELQDIAIPQELRPDYSNHIDVFLYIDGLPVGNKTLDIVWDETGDVSFSFPAWLSPGEHIVGIYTKLDNDCECSGSSFRNLTETLTVLPACGNGLVNPWEECELPFTQDNAYCGQIQAECLGSKLGTRDAFGNCDGSCSCAPDAFAYSCAQGMCGAACDEPGDYHAADSVCYYGCDFEESCSYQGGCSLEPYCSGDIWNHNGQCSGSGCSFDSLDCSSLDYYDEFEAYCSGSGLRQHRLFHHFTCSPSGCMENPAWVDDSLIDDCDAYDGQITEECGMEDWTCDSNTLSCRIGTTTPDDALCPDFCDSDARNYNGECGQDNLCEYLSEDCGLDGTYCSGDGVEQRHYYCTPSRCEYEAEPLGQCSPHDGWYNYGDDEGGDDPACELRDYFCQDSGLSDFCNYSMQERHDYDALDGAYCSGRESVETRDYYCNSAGQAEHTSAAPEDCGPELWFGGSDTQGFGPDPDCSYLDYFCAGEGPAAYCGSRELYNSSFDSLDNPYECFGLKAGMKDYWCDPSQCDPLDPINDCGPGSTDHILGCSLGCGADCEEDSHCPDSACGETYYDYCNGTRLVEYDDDRAVDSTTVANSTPNACLSDCLCTDIPVTCGAPETSSYCVQGICGAACGEDRDCHDTECDYLDGCYGGTYRDYLDVPNTCDLEACGCSENACEAYGEIITDNDGDGYDTECDSDCDDTDPLAYPGAPETCDGRDNDCDGETDEGLAGPCGSGLCAGITVCESGAWSDCSSRGQDAGTCAVCDESGSVAYDGTQDSDCDPNDLPWIATCFNDPDGIDFTWDYAGAFDSECASLYECSSGEYQYSHTCSMQSCLAECESGSDCGPYLQGDYCFYSSGCSPACECLYSPEFCPEPGAVIGNMCYYGSHECTETGCGVSVCELESGYDACDPLRGCISCIGSGTIIDSFYGGLGLLNLTVPLRNLSDTPRVFVDADYRIFNAGLRLTGYNVDIAVKQELDVVLVNDISTSMDDDCPGGDADPGEHPCKINDLKAAEAEFINLVIDGNAENNRIAMVAYSTRSDGYLELTNNKTLLTEEMESYELFGATCIACGIESGTEMVARGTNPTKTMLVMSDGKANRCLSILPQHCTEEAARQEAIDKAMEAWETHGIRVFAIAFGNDSGIETMQDIAEAGNGGFYYADNGNITQAYTDIAIAILHPYPLDPALDVGGDGSAEWSFPGTFNTSELTGDFGAYLDGLLGCTCPGCLPMPDGCLIDFNVHSESDGIMILDRLNITGCMLQTEVECSSCSDCGGGPDCMEYGGWSGWSCGWEGVCDKSTECYRERTVTSYTCNSPGGEDSYCSMEASSESQAEGQGRETEGMPCGLFRPCPDDQCISLNLTIFPPDGHDYCSGGICLEWPCLPVSSQEDPACAGDTDGDGVEDTEDLCPGTPPGEAAGQDGCSCSQKVCDDTNPDTLDTCSNRTGGCVHVLSSNITAMLLLSEVFYDTPGPDAEEEWLEIYNPFSYSVNLSGYIISDNSGAWEIPGIIMGPESLVTIARKWTGFFGLYGCYPNRDGLTLSLSNSGDMLNLSHRAKALDFVAWEGSAPGWDLFANTGFSIRRAWPYTIHGGIADWENNTVPTPSCLDHMDYDGDYYDSALDCDDTDPLAYPGAPETCDGRDNDCDGMADNFPGGNDSITRQCGVSDAGDCLYGSQACVSGGWGPCEGNIDPAGEVCDGRDNDCDGSADEGISCGVSTGYTGGGGGGGGYTCTEKWSCGEWSECSPAGLQNRACRDLNSCGSHARKPPEQGNCTYEPPAAACRESWICYDWSPCLNGTQGRECWDANDCGTGTGRPVEERNCTPEVPGICTEGNVTCLGSELMNCSGPGGWVRVETCEHGCANGRCNPPANVTAPAGLAGYLTANPGVLILGIIIVVIIVLGGVIYLIFK